MSKQNHWEERPICPVNRQVHRTRRIITLQKAAWVTDGTGSMLKEVEGVRARIGFAAPDHKSTAGQSLALGTLARTNQGTA